MNTISKTLRSVVSFCILAAILSSCTIVSFDRVLPEPNRVFRAFPKAVQGNWINDEGEQLEINGSLFEAGDFEGKIGPDCQLVVEHDWYYLNLKEDKYWMLFIGHLENDNTLNVYWFDGDDEELVTGLQELYDARIFRDDQGEIERIHFSPSDDEFREIMEKGLFSDMGTFLRQ
jgi:hypothetical protein